MMYQTHIYNIILLSIIFQIYFLDYYDILYIFITIKKHRKFPLYASYLNNFNLNEFSNTDTELNDIANAANIGFNLGPLNNA